MLFMAAGGVGVLALLLRERDGSAAVTEEKAALPPKEAQYTPAGLAPVTGTTVSPAVIAAEKAAAKLAHARAGTLRCVMALYPTVPGRNSLLARAESATTYAQLIFVAKDCQFAYEKWLIARKQCWSDISSEADCKDLLWVPFAGPALYADCMSDREADERACKKKYG